jgi:hypothetical protein
MSEENVEVVRRNTDAFSRGDLDGFMEGWAADAVVDWSNSRGFEAGVYRGRSEMLSFARRFHEAFDEIQSSWLTVRWRSRMASCSQRTSPTFAAETGIEVQAQMHG